MKFELGWQHQETPGRTSETIFRDRPHLYWKRWYVNYQVDQPPPEIGTVPSFFSGSLYASMEHLDVLKLVYFYNDDMGIEAGYNLCERTEAVRGYLLSY